MDRTIPPSAAPAPEPGLPSVKGPTKVQCYATGDHPPKLVPAAADRPWMDTYVNRHPYRCLPLTIANSHGWFLLSPVPFEAEWNGGDDLQALTVRGLKPLPGGRPFEHFCSSHFGHGIITMHTDYLFRTEPGWDLLASGPFNAPKDGCAALTGIMESDWSPYPFTMNWKLTRPGRIRFEEDEPFCFIFPIPKQALVDTQLEIRRLADDPELMRQQEAFRQQRGRFLERLHAQEPETVRQGWQRHYFTGQHLDGTQVPGHTSKLRLKDPIDRRGTMATQSPVPQTSNGLWETGSILDTIDPAQSDRNQAGRARVVDGVLTPSPETRQIGRAAEARGLDFLCIEDTLTAQECATLRRAFGRVADKLFVDHRLDPYWNNRSVGLADIQANDPEAAAVMVAQAHRIRAAITLFYRLIVPIYNNSLHIVQWPVGLATPPHTGRSEPDASHHDMAHRDFCGMTYLNDDYEGGELYFTALDIAIKPRPGLFLGFTGGFRHEHAILRVTDGATRLAIPAFYSFDLSKAEAGLDPAGAAAVPGK